MASFLRVLLDRKDDGMIDVTQTSLTDQIIKASNIGRMKLGIHRKALTITYQ
jgi:hypothetical protein